MAVDANTQEIVVVELTANFVGSSEALPDLVKQLPDNETISSIAGDVAYDKAICHQAITTKQAQAVIPPRAGAVE